MVEKLLYSRKLMRKTAVDKMRTLEYEAYICSRKQQTFLVRKESEIIGFRKSLIRIGQDYKFLKRGRKGEFLVMFIFSDMFISLMVG